MCWYYKSYKKIIKYAQSCNVLTVIDACQSIVHQEIDVQNLDCDFLVFQAINYMVLLELEYYMENG